MPVDTAHPHGQPPIVPPPGSEPEKPIEPVKPVPAKPVVEEVEEPEEKKPIAKPTSRPSPETRHSKKK